MPTKVIRCECGHTIQGADDDQLVANAQEHARDAHGMEITRDEALAMAEFE